VTDDGLQTTDKSGPLNSSMMSIIDCEVMGIASENATQVIPLLTNHPSNRAVAWNVEVLTWYNLGHIPRIYLYWTIPPSQEDHAILSSVRESLPGINGTFSVISRLNGGKKVLLCVSSSKATDSPVSSPAA
jgi:hypothetical protein